MQETTFSTEYCKSKQTKLVTEGRAKLILRHWKKTFIASIQWPSHIFSSRSAFPLLAHEAVYQRWHKDYQSITKDSSKKQLINLKTYQQ